MKYPLSEKYDTPELMAKIMGPNPIKLEEELLQDNLIPEGATVCDLGSGQGLTSVFLAKEYGFKVYAADLWSDPEENRKFFKIRKNSPANHVFLGFQRSRFQAGAAVLEIELYQTGKRHFAVGCGTRKKVAFIIQRLFLCLEALLLFLLAYTVPVGVTELAKPCSRLLLFVNRHLFHPFFSQNSVQKRKIQVHY